MISAVTGLPAIVIDKFKELENQVDLSSKDQGIQESNKVTDNLNKQSVNNDLVSNKAKSNSNKVDYSKLADKLKSLLGDNNLTIEFAIDKDIQKMVMKVINNQTQEVVKQFPPDITIKIAKIVTSALGNGNLTDATV